MPKGDGVFHILPATRQDSLNTRVMLHAGRSSSINRILPLNSYCANIYKKFYFQTANKWVLIPQWYITVKISPKHTHLKYKVILFKILLKSTFSVDYMLHRQLSFSPLKGWELKESWKSRPVHRTGHQKGFHQNQISIHWLEFETFNWWL